MGGKGYQSQSTTGQQTQTTTLPEASPEEVQLRQQFENLGDSQKAQIQRLLGLASGTGGSSLYQLNAQDQAALDASYQGTINQYNTQAGQYADQLAGGRGLRMSDTPVAQQAIQQYGLGMGNILSSKANQGLNMGFNANQFGLQAAQALPSSLTVPYQGLLAARMAQPTVTGTGSSVTSGSMTQPLMQTILQGTQAYNQWSQGNKANMEGITAGMAMGGM